MCCCKNALKKILVGVWAETRTGGLGLMLVQLVAGTEFAVIHYVCLCSKLLFQAFANTAQLTTWRGAGAKAHHYALHSLDTPEVSKLAIALPSFCEPNAASWPPFFSPFAKHEPYFLLHISHYFWLKTRQFWIQYSNYWLLTKLSNPAVFLTSGKHSCSFSSVLL